MKKIVVAVAVLVVAALVIWVIAFRPGGPASATAMAPQKLPVRSTAEQERLIYEAVDRNDIAAVRTLLAGAPSVALANSGQNGETPLHLARSVEMAQLLLDAGADPNARDRTYDARPSRWAISNWRPEVVAFLDSKAPPDTDIAALCATGKLPQLMAMLQKDRALAQGKTSGRDVLGANRSLLHVAALYGQAEVCRVLATHGADVASEGGFFNAQPLEFAAWAGFPDTVKALIEYGADVNAQVVAGDQGTHTAIWWAALTGRKEVVAILLDAGASIEPDLIAAVRKSEASPYPGRALPPREDYDAVIELLQKHVDAPRNGK